MSSKRSVLISKIDWRFEALFLGLVLFGIVLSLSLWMREAGLPRSHEYFNHVIRTALYAEHFRQWDLFPIWFSSDGLGMGTALPVFYHKTFYYLAGMVFVAGVSIKTALLVTVACFMIVGAYGMRYCAGLLQTGKLLMVASALALIFSQYVFTDWLVRAAMAEFSAMMLIPWLIWWCLLLIRDAKFSWAIVPILFLLYHGHNVTAVFSTILLGSTVVLFAFRYRWPGIRRNARKAAVSIALLALLMMPQVLLQTSLMADYDPTKITQAGYQASQNILPITRYFHDADYVWLKSWEFITVQLDRPVLVTLIAAVVTIVIARLMGKQYRLRAWYGRHGWLLLTLAVPFAVYLFLQSAWSRPVYEHIAVLQLLQFPWRLLAYVTPIGILLTIMVLAAISNTKTRFAVVMIWLASFVLLSPLTQRFQYPFYGPSEVNDYISGERMDLTGAVLAGIGEYYPVVQDGTGQTLGSQETLTLYQQLYAEDRQLEVLSGDCTVSALPAVPALEIQTRQFSLDCRKGSEVALPISYNRFSDLRLQQADGTSDLLDAHRRSDDPRLIIRVGAVKGVLSVDLPRLQHILLSKEM